MSLLDIIFVPFNYFLDFRFQSFDCLRPNLMNFILFPFLFPDFFTCLPRLFIFAQLHLKLLILPFLLFLHLSSLFLHLIKHLFNLCAQAFFIIKEVFNHPNLFLNSYCHFTFDLFRCFVALLFCKIYTLTELISFFLSKFFNHIKSFCLFFFLQLKFNHTFPHFGISFPGVTISVINLRLTAV